MITEKEIIEDLIIDEAEAIKKYSKYAEIFNKYDKNIANLLLHIKKEEEHHLQELKNLGREVNITLGTIGRIIKDFKVIGG